MKALSIRQPWAWAILCSGKRIENRARKDGRMPSLCSYRGPLLIHASAGMTVGEFTEARDFMLDRNLLQRSMPYRQDLPRGGAVGVCTVVNHIEPTGAVRRADGTLGAPPSDARDFLAWHVTGSFGLVLADVRPLPFVPFKGALGFFDVPDHLVPGAVSP